MNPATGVDGGAAALSTLQTLGARHVFGVPGTQSTSLYEALRRSSLRSIVPTHELAAAFMAGAYFRVSGSPGILTTIPGPGLAYALTGLAEARLDSAAVVYILNAQAQTSRIGYGPQAIDQRALLAPVTKAVIRATGVAEVGNAIREAWHLSLAGEPGPVAVELADGLNQAASCPPGPTPESTPESTPRPAAPAPTDHAIAKASRALASAKRPILLIGQGALGCSHVVADLARRWNAPVLTTPSARGSIPETEPLAMGFDVLRGGVDAVNRLIETADVVVAIGAKLAHNGSAGSRLVIPQEKFVRVDQSAEAIAAVYPAAHALVMRAESFLALPVVMNLSRSQWSAGDLAAHRSAIRMLAPAQEPSICGQNASTFFDAFARALPADARLVTDTGMHQVMARRHLDFTAAGGLLMPSDLQSMGFGLPAAIAAALADPTRPVVALIGDGGLRMTGFEIATAVREGVSLTVVVLNDGCLNQIRLQQLSEHGASSGTELGPLDLLAFADAVGAQYIPAGTLDALSALGDRRRTGVTLIEVPVGDNASIHLTSLKARARRFAREALGERLTTALKHLRR